VGTASISRVGDSQSLFAPIDHRARAYWYSRRTVPQSQRSKPEQRGTEQGEARRFGYSAHHGREIENEGLVVRPGKTRQPHPVEEISQSIENSEL